MIQTAVPDALPPIDEASFHGIADLVFRHTGIRLGPGKSYFVQGRLAGLYRALGCNHWRELQARFQNAAHSKLIEALVEAVVTPETSFFRDGMPFRAIREKLLPDVLASGSSPVPMRIWSAGCSTGQEPYSVVMTLWNEVNRGDVELEVWATDICQAALDRACRGVYGPLELDRGVHPGTRRTFFEEIGGGSARIRDEIRARVRFERLNLATEMPSRGDFHAVLCRNVGIYFDVAGKQRLYRIIGDSVQPGGYLILGAAETLFPGIPGFETVYFERFLLFRKLLEASCERGTRGQSGS